MRSFLEKHRAVITGVLSGFDRLVLRGTLLGLVYPTAMMSYLYAMGVRLKDFGKHVLEVTSRIKEAAAPAMLAAGRPVIYLPSSRTSKEEQACAIVERDRISEGPICMLSSLEPCRSFDVFRNRETKRLELVRRYRHCLHLYQYWMHPVVGFMNVRIQTWFPFSIQICLNGREWLARDLDRHHIGYKRADNCFVALEHVERAQELMDGQLRVAWPELLADIAKRINPAHDELFAKFPVGYYWSVFQSEWATDVMFRTPADLAEIFRPLVRHGMTTFSSPDVMRFLGRRVPLHGVHRNFCGQVTTDVKDRRDGVRIKHRLDRNSIETTINDAHGFRVFRPNEGESACKSKWQRMRQGIADLHRRAKVSNNANRRYLAGLSSKTPLSASWHGDSASPARSMTAACGPSTPGPSTTTRCSSLSPAASSPSTAFAMLTCAIICSPRRPTHPLSNAAVPLPSLESSACSAPTASSRSCPGRIAINSLQLAAPASPRSSSLPTPAPTLSRSSPPE